MNKKLFLSAIAALAFTLPFTSCSKENDPTIDDEETESANVDYNSSNAKSWGNYMYNVASLLKTDATTLYNAWNTSYNNGDSYASIFKNQKSPYTSLNSCIQEILEGCIDIANEVGDAKIGDPYNLYKSGKTTEALYAVESWYSWHSRDDYRNNILSIRNSYYGSLDGSINANSISAFLASVDSDRDVKVKNAISAAAEAIYDIPQPFRNNIISNEADAAMDACAELTTILENAKNYITANFNDGSKDAELKKIVDNYVDGVVLPTYKLLMENNGALYDAIVTFRSNPSDSNFEKACQAWLTAREPWEKSEAFLFGPVDALGLDPNMDSWPLDQDAIVQILNSGNFDSLDWTDGDSDDKIEAVQSVRGFHTLEFLLFKDGVSRKVNN